MKAPFCPETFNVSLPLNKIYPKMPLEDVEPRIGDDFGDDIGDDIEAGAQTIDRWVRVIRDAKILQK